MNFLGRVHDERPITRDRFIQRTAADEQYASGGLAVGRCLNADFITVFFESNHIAPLDVCSVTGEKDRSFYDVGECVEIARYGLNDFASGFEPEIQIENWRAG